MKNIPPHWSIRRRKEGTLSFTFEETLIEPALGSEPHIEVYKKGIPREGWLAFEAYPWGEVEFPNAQFDLHLKDSLGGAHCIRRPSGVYAKTGEFMLVSPASRIPT